MEKEELEIFEKAVTAANGKQAYYEAYIEACNWLKEQAEFYASYGKDREHVVAAYIQLLHEMKSLE